MVDNNNESHLTEAEKELKEKITALIWKDAAFRLTIANCISSVKTK